MATNPKEVQVMPSYFASLQSTQSSPLASFMELQRLITKDFNLKALTDAYRKRLEISKDFANEAKPLSPAISTSLLYDGYGRSLEHVKGEPRLLALDFDNLSPEALEKAFDIAKQCPYSKVVFHTISGRGLRIIISYTRPEDCELSIVELFNEMMAKAITFYGALLGIEPDLQCRDIGRLCGLAHDDNAYFCWDAQPMSLSPSEMKAALDRKIQRERHEGRRKGGRPKGSGKGKGKNGQASYGGQVPSIEEAAPQIKKMLDAYGKIFSAGTHNEYVTSFAYICLKYGIDERDTTNYAVTAFSTDYLKELADRITIEDHPGYFHSQKDFEEYFKKWFTSMVVAWLNPKVVNQTMPVLVGKGGIGKTTLFDSILPPALRAYYMNDSTSNYLDKDTMEAMASMAMVNLDEFEATYGRNLSAFKSNMTKLKFSVRLPYDKYRSELVHHCSLCGAGQERVEGQAP